MPVVALGTFTVWLAKPGEVYSGVKAAVEAGYRHIDCAWVYDNEEEVGQALTELFSEGKVKREDLFITTKIWDTFHGRVRAKLNLEKSLARLKIPSVDLCLFHWPTCFKDGDESFPKGEDGKIIYGNHDIVDTYKGLEDCVTAGLARNIGISNFNSQQIQRVLNEATIKPSNLQIEVNPCFTNEKLVKFAQSKGLTVSSYASLGSPGRPWQKNTDPCALTDPVVTGIAEAKGRTPAQVILRWHIQRDLAIVVKSVNPDRIRKNLQVFDFELSDSEMAQISGLNKDFRLYVEDVALEHPDYPFHIEF